MRHVKRVLCCVPFLALWAIGAPALAQTAPRRAGAPAPPPAGATAVQEIVVTAQKRQENVNSVGMSIQAASGDQLTRLGVNDTAQLQKIVPGFSYVQSAYGGPVYSIRGIGFQDTSLAGSPTVSVYLDETPLPFSIMTKGATLDLQRVEVLKGPQGTLFGENATGGAINYIANKPTDVFQAGADLSYSRFNTVDLQGFVGGPIADGLDFRLALRGIQSDGWQKNYTNGDTLGAQHFLNGRIALQWRPNDRLKVLLTLNGYQDRSEPQAPQLVEIQNLNTNTPLPPYITSFPPAPRNAQAAAWDSCINVSSFNDRCTYPHNNNTFYSGTLRIDYEFSDDLTLTSLTSYEKFDRYSAIPGDGTDYQDYQSLQKGFLNTVYQEFRLAGRFSGRGDWIVGVNYQYDNTWDNFLQTYTDSSSATIFGLPLGPTNPSDRQHTSTYAVFANAEYPITPSLLLQGGVRFTQSDKTLDYDCGKDGGDGSWSLVSQAIQNYLLTGNPFYGAPPSDPLNPAYGPGVNPGPGACATTGLVYPWLPGNTPQKLDQSNISWRTGLNWTVTPGTMLYFNVSQGWKAGGFPTAATARAIQLVPAVQEGLLAYEGGFKAALFDRRLQLNGAVFYYDYTNKQILGDVDDLVFGALPALVNVPRSHVIGFELSGNWEPIPGLTIVPTVSYADSRIDHCPASLPSCAAMPAGGNVPVAIPAGDFHNFNYLGQEQDFTGESFPSAPQWQADVDIQYQWRLQDDVTAFLGANVNYQGQTNSSFGGFSILNVPAYTLLDLRAGVAKGDWRFQLWGRNVTNRYYWTAAYHVNDVDLRYAGMPATYGMTLTYRFH